MLHFARKNEGFVGPMRGIRGECPHDWDGIYTNEVVGRIDMCDDKSVQYLSV